MEKKAELIKKMLEEKLLTMYGVEAEEATKKQIYSVLLVSVRDLLATKNKEFQKQIKKESKKRVYYMSMEFLVGTSLRNNIYNLDMVTEFEEALKDLGFSLSELYSLEPDAGLGNGGLGRLASCYMDSLSTKGVCCTGYSIRYEFGIFKQKIVDGWQMEFPDNWLSMGGKWLIERPDDSVEVRFGGEVKENWEEGRNVILHTGYDTVIAAPYVMMIPGYKSNAVNELVLWSAKSPDSLDMELFSRGEYVKSMESNAMAEAISKVLYPADDHYTGKKLRLKQQYLLVSASLQNIIKDFMKDYKDIRRLPDKVAIHINDTHPSLCVPELMRLLLDEHGLSWEDAWEICSKTLAYTNHTVMSEALERWPVGLFAELMPRVYMIVREIDRRFNIILNENYGGDNAKINYMQIIADGNVKMANLCLFCCHKVNGVSKLHSEILKNDVFRDFYYIMPDKFTNVTNGIAYRRWLCQANPLLTDFLKSLIGDEFMKDAGALTGLLNFKDDKNVLESLEKIKLKNKERLAKYISEANGINVDPESIFDVQIKRLHEYKRQLLNIMHIIYLYKKLLENPNMEIKPRTFIFGAKASSGYVMAKQIIRLINCVAKEVNSNPITRDKLKVVFLEDYKVSLAEIIIPAAEISEQISVAGKEASGTGNMKLMINGAVTLGTLDGANVEILERVGPENIFIFGMSAEDVTELWKKGYNPMEIYKRSEDVKKVIDTLKEGIGGASFADIAGSLTQGNYGQADAYMSLADFDSYKAIHEEVLKVYADREKFNKMSLINIAEAGVFSADRSVSEYCEKIWKI